jgi:hypothetical protein
MFPTLVDGRIVEQNLLTEEHKIEPDKNIFFEGEITEQDETFIHLKIDTTEDEEEEELKNKIVTFVFHKLAVTVED